MCNTTDPLHWCTLLTNQWACHEWVPLCPTTLTRTCYSQIARILLLGIILALSSLFFDVEYLLQMLLPDRLLLVDLITTFGWFVSKDLHLLVIFDVLFIVFFVIIILHLFLWHTLCFVLERRLLPYFELSPLVGDWRSWVAQLGDAWGQKMARWCICWRDWVDIGWIWEFM